jgi:hypothetical protein
MSKGLDIMNPVTWRREHQLALILGGVIGIAIGLLIGYIYDTLWSMFVVAMTATAGNAPNPPRVLTAWLGSGSSFRWGAFGALVGGLMIYTRQLLHA